ncbi:exonuclease SbcCD subunit D [uncultured Eubacterium sp.]|uniref:exonuclease SbcCD subunit D n=1 Tax=uncultured Eubacterium sp. TaxID=165185 RepID=UPI0025E95492|nr:exonuclease SbcCD subunit D [uncultured Eubacterium sp.]MCI6536051.1 exonuclease SbcCD subunit D [Lachnospiraceae bacterium]
MKFFHLSDLHIGLKLINWDLREDQEYILHQIVELAVRERPDALVIAGDIYDKAVPSAEAMEVLDGFIAELTQKLPELVIMMISGNHDSASRVNCYRSVLARQNLYMIGVPPVRPEEFMEKVVLRDAYGPVNFYLLPFVKPSTVKQITGTDEKGNNLSYDETLHRLLARETVDTVERNVLVSHQFYLPVGKSADEVERMDSEIRTVGNIDEVSVEVLQLFDYAALGHIHKPMKVGSEVARYCGTPLACSVSEAGQQKGVIEVELGAKGQVQTRVLPLHPLRQIRVLRGTAAEVLAQACDDYVSVMLTDLPDFDTQDRIRAAFPYLLEIRRETLLQRDYVGALKAQEKLDPYEICCSFLGDVPEKEMAILQDVVNHVFTEGETE